MPLFSFHEWGEVVSAITGTPRDKLLRVYEIYSSTGAPGKAATIMYAMGWIYVLHQPEAEFQMTVRASTSRPLVVARRSLLRPFGALAAAAFLGSARADSDSPREEKKRKAEEILAFRSILIYYGFVSDEIGLFFVARAG